MVELSGLPLFNIIAQTGKTPSSREFLLRLLPQGGHTLWKTGKMVKKNPCSKKIREFEILLKIREKSGNFKKSYLCKVKIFKFYSCSDVATGGFFLAYALNTCRSNIT